MHLSKMPRFKWVHLLIVGLLGGTLAVMFYMAYHPGSETLVREEAVPIYELLQLAQVEAVAGGRAVTWSHDGKGYRFSRPNRQGTGLDYFDDSVFSPSAWRSGSVKISSTPDPIVLSPDSTRTPWEVVFSEGQVSLIIQRDSDGQIQAQIVTQPDNQRAICAPVFRKASQLCRHTLYAD